MRKAFVFWSSLVVFVMLIGGAWVDRNLWWGFVVVGPIVAIGAFDMTQKRHAIRRNFPVIGHFRYLFESIRPEINQYFIESDTDGTPFSRSQRSLVYQRGKQETDTVPFGTKLDVYAVGYEWVNHSLMPKHCDPASLRLTLGEGRCKKPYSASIFNIAAMSYGALSRNAILALNGGAKRGHFYHDTGEGGLSPYHLEAGGDICWEIGTGYFGCRTAHGLFDEAKFADKAQHPHVKMVELKLSQGAKPGHGGILPASKVTAEISAIRGVEMGKDVLSPPAHSAFATPVELLELIAKMRELSGGKPAGFKLCIGKRREFMAICKAMTATGIVPDFIAIDGGEGGTGAAPLEFSNYVGSPLTEALIFAHNCLVGAGLRDQLKLIVSGKVISGFDIVSRIAIGADACSAARSMMLALGCIQALRCNNNTCPTGVATQDPHLIKGLDVGDKTARVAHYHQETIKSVAELIGAMGLTHTDELRPWHLLKRMGLNTVQHYGEIFPHLEAGELLGGDVPRAYARDWQAASPDTFGPG